MRWQRASDARIGVDAEKADAGELTDRWRQCARKAVAADLQRCDVAFRVAREHVVVVGAAVELRVDQSERAVRCVGRCAADRIENRSKRNKLTGIDRCTSNAGRIATAWRDRLTTRHVQTITRVLVVRWIMSHNDLTRVV